MTGRLVSTADADTVWAGQVQRHATDLGRAEEELARRVLEALHRPSQPAVRPTESGQAHDLYLRGRFHYNRWEAEDVRRAISYFDRALAIDPGFALAYAGLSESYYQLSSRVLRPEEAMPKARAAAHRALQLDSPSRRPTSRSRTYKRTSTSTGPPRRRRSGTRSS